MELYVSGYTDEALDTWAQLVRGWRTGASARSDHTLATPAPPTPREVFVYLDNDAKVRAPADALSLARRLQLGGQPASRLRSGDPEIG